MLKPVTPVSVSMTYLRGLDHLIGQSSEQATFRRGFRVSSVLNRPTVYNVPPLQTLTENSLSTTK